jgi:ribosomal RNA-processing protein 36
MRTATTTGSLGDSEESDVDVDAPRVAQWVDEEELEQLEVASGDASHGKVVNAEDIVRVVHVSPKFGWFIALYRKPSKTVSWSTMSVGGCPSSHLPTDLASLPLGALRRAQRALARAQAEENPSDSEEEEKLRVRVRARGSFSQG